MKDWLIYFFGSFFSHRLAREGQNRSLMNGVLSLCLAIALMVVAMSAGYRLSFPGALSQATEFLEYTDEALSGLQLQVTDGKLQGDPLVSTEGEVLLVVDLRDLSLVYDDFSVIGTAQDGTTVSYEEYKALSDSAKTGYTLSLEFSGRELDVTDPALQAQYLEYLQAAAKFDADLAENLENLSPEEENYAQAIYVLYVTDYYDGMNLSDGFGAAPTLQGYYSSLTADGGQYLLLFSQWCTASFESQGRDVVMMGYYTGLEGYTSADGVQALLAGAFAESGNLSLLTYFMNLMSGVPVLMMIWAGLAVALFAICRWRKLESGHRLPGAFQITGSFLTVSGLATAVLGFGLSAFLPQAEAYGICVLVLYGLFALRCVVYIAVEFMELVPGGEYVEWEEA